MSNDQRLLTTSNQKIPRSFAIAALLLCAVNPALGREIPAKFALHASFFPGPGGVKGGPIPWRLTIGDKGVGSQEATILGANTPPGARGVVKKVVVSRAGFERLVKAIERADFFTLPRELSISQFEHIAGVVLKITMDGQTREVKFIVPNDTYDSAALRRFWPVSRAVVKEVPSPNKNEELMHWIRYVRPDLTKRSIPSIKPRARKAATDVSRGYSLRVDRGVPFTVRARLVSR